MKKESSTNSRKCLGQKNLIYMREVTDFIDKFKKVIS